MSGRKATISWIRALGPIFIQNQMICAQLTPLESTIEINRCSFYAVDPTNEGTFNIKSIFQTNGLQSFTAYGRS